MKLLKNIASLVKKLNDTFGIQTNVTWLEFRKKWIEENNVNYQ